MREIDGLCDLLFGTGIGCAILHGFHKIGSGCSFERQAVAHFPHKALFEGMNEVHPRVTTSHFGNFQVQVGQFARSSDRLPICHNLSDNSPFVGRACRQRLWIE